MNIHQMTLDHSSSSLGPHCLMMSVHISSGLVLHLDVVWTKQFKPLSHHKMFGLTSSNLFRLMSYLVGICFLKSTRKVYAFRDKESVVSSALSFDNEKRNLLSRSLLHDNIIPKPDLALELGKSISLTEAEEKLFAREKRTESETEAATPKGDKDQGEVDSSTITLGVSIPVSDPEKTHEALAGPDPEPMQEDQTGSNSGKLHVSLAGPNPEHMDDEFLATAYPKVHENLKLITDKRVIEENPENKSKVKEESDSTIPDPSHQTVTSTPPVIAPFTDVSSTKPSLLVTPPPINMEATTITTSLPEITPFIALQLRVARLEQEMSEVKKTDHSADVLASIKSQVPTVVDKYLGTKLDDALLKILERHTADLIEKYSVLPGPESIKNQESEKSPKEIIKIKREQGEEKQDSTYSIRSTDKVALEEFDLKSALFKHMNKNKTVNRNLANYHLYHALIEALIVDEDAMDKEVVVKVKDHKRKHDSDDEEDDDDDDEGPSTGSNQGRSAKRRRPKSATSGSAQPPPKDDDQNDVVNSSMPRFDTESEHSEQSLDDIPMQDEGHVSDLENTDNAHIPKVSTTTWFKPILEGKRPATPEPELTIPPNDFPEPENNWANTYATTYQVLAENKLQRKTYDIRSFIKWFCRRTGKKKLCKADLEGPTFNLVKAFHKNNVSLQYQMDEWHKLLTNKVDLGNLEGHQIMLNIYEPLPLGGPPGQLRIESYQTKINLERPNWDAADYYFKEDYTIVPKPRAVVYRDRNDQRKLMRLNELHKFSDGTLTRVMEKLDHMVKDFHLFEYNKGMETRKWSEDDKRRSKDFITAIEKRLQIRRIFRSLESFVGGRIRDIDYRLINRTT
ncbi:hypothetical protein Tco_1391471 [Tanacetum coccineum]